MQRIINVATLMISLLLILVGITACGGDEPNQESSDQPAGSELVSKMNDAVKAVNSANFSAEFQFATVDGPVKGTFQFWGERPDKTRVEITSDDESLNGMVAVTSDGQGSAYSPSENLFLVAEGNQLKTQLNEQPELRDILTFAEQIYDEGLENTQAESKGAETVNGRETEKVEVKYDNSDLEGVTVIYYIDKETFLPQKIETNITRDGFTVSGFALLTGDPSTDAAIDVAQFTFTPPADATVLDLETLPALPDFSSSEFSDVFKEE